MRRFMATIRYKQRGEKWYVYEVHQYWDKELKKPRQQTKYLGVAKEKGGKYMKTGKVLNPKTEKEILDYGDTFAINEVAKSISLHDLIDENLENLDTIMTLIAFQITEGSAMYNCSLWYEGNIAKKLFPNGKISSQDISNLFKHLGRQEVQNKFFKSYINKFFGFNNSILIDSTALASAINTSINQFGYSSGNIEKNVSCLMLVDKESKLPMHFRVIGGDIPDICTLKTTVGEIKKLGLETRTAILDAGFCSKENLQFMCEENIEFITRLPRRHKVFRDMIEGIGDIEDISHGIRYGDRVVFIESKEVTLYDNKVYAHVILDPQKKSKDTHTLLVDKLDDYINEKEKQELDIKMKMAGYFILLSKKEMKRSEVLPNYYTRQSIEQLFRFAKSNNNILPLRVHDEYRVKGYLMLVFLAIIVFVTMRQRVAQPMDKVLLTLRSLKAKIFDDEVIVQEQNKRIKEILKKLGI